ncbi:NtaA/DmoA family FMN-dependent monooxygenase [Saccharopolyspora spinosporotrichia]
MSDRPFKLFAFDVQAPAHLTAGSWRNGDDQGHRYAELGYWTDTAKLLEQACFDGIFLADTVGYHDVYAGSPDAAIRDAAQFPINDPALLVSGMAAVTEHLGFGVTSSLTYEQPYSLARKFSTLDHLTGGRVGWNIVTSYSESAARNLGLGKQIPHDRRYDMAEEYMQVCYGLWEYSWQDDAVVRDRESATYAEPGRIRPINHEGEYFQVPGFHLCEPSPQRTPVLFQAGASSRGVAFAGTHAEAVFINTMTPELTRRSVDKVRKAAADAGRDPRSVLITALITVVVAPTDAQAQEKYESYLRSVSYEERWLGSPDGPASIFPATTRTCPCATSRPTPRGPSSRCSPRPTRAGRGLRARSPSSWASAAPVRSPSGRRRPWRPSCAAGRRSPTSTASTSATPASRRAGSSSSTSRCPSSAARSSSTRTTTAAPSPCGRSCSARAGT